MAVIAVALIVLTQHCPFLISCAVVVLLTSSCATSSAFVYRQTALFECELNSIRKVDIKMRQETLRRQVVPLWSLVRATVEVANYKARGQGTRTRLVL